MVVVVSQMLVNNGDESHGIESRKKIILNNKRLVIITIYHHLEFEKTEGSNKSPSKVIYFWVLLETKPWFSKKTAILQ